MGWCILPLRQAYRDRARTQNSGKLICGTAVHRRSMVRSIDPKWECCVGRLSISSCWSDWRMWPMPVGISAADCRGIAKVAIACLERVKKIVNFSSNSVHTSHELSSPTSGLFCHTYEWKSELSFCCITDPQHSRCRWGRAPLTSHAPPSLSAILQLMKATCDGWKSRRSPGQKSRQQSLQATPGPEVGLWIPWSMPAPVSLVAASILTSSPAS